ncbi:unnamed protein product [Protopolystoma xenopodis]|uniref:Uncharacterized protein n=1 Tax=Protopolystoma xenopodis TaxID=117903 RepID=A0A448X4A6_9PLAT|nr:unnamed protein product [Protopolystoma xenopodis]
MYVRQCHVLLSFIRCPPSFSPSSSDRPAAFPVFPLSRLSSWLLRNNLVVCRGDANAYIAILLHHGALNRLTPTHTITDTGLTEKNEGALYSRFLVVGCAQSSSLVGSTVSELTSISSESVWRGHSKVDSTRRRRRIPLYQLSIGFTGTFMLTLYPT